MMKFVYAYLVLMALGCTDSGSSKVTTDTSETENITEPSAACIFQESGFTRLDKTPFSESDKIAIVSYPVRKNALNEVNLIQNNQVKIDEFKEEVVLNESQVDSLFSILYNYTSPAISPAADCYNPRHAILFYKENKPFAFLELCFECNNVIHSKDLNFGKFCEEKMCLLQHYFQSMGIQNGLNPAICP